MDWITALAAVVIGIAAGAAIMWFARRGQAAEAKRLADELFAQNEARHKAELDAVLANVRADFGSLSRTALSQSTEEFLKLANERFESQRSANSRELDGKKQLIDQQLEQITRELEKVSAVAKELEKDREAKFGQLAGQLETTGKQTQRLMQTTEALRQALASTKVRGQWGERMAEDVLRMAGLIENYNYRKQKSIEGAGSRPDFTFLLPANLCLNMDVKFPLDNYLRYLETESETDKARYKSDFLRDVKSRIKEVTTRDYINPQQNTVDYVLMFIPNEQVYAFIHEQDREILDTALKSKVVICSPVTLFAVLAVIRQAVDNFALEKTSNEILSLLGGFRKQWGEFVKKMDSMGKKIADAQREYEALTTTRQRALERPLNKLDDLRQDRGLPSSDDMESPPDLLD
ncbi:MAG: DNA recombination protein RmuC [candidate division Zixibacteria bacterium]|jgi:DNA recombination protein RmuC|nr:DNA recombination protein RmuC [candidate division Zixibacteria bacterium]